MIFRLVISIRVDMSGKNNICISDLGATTSTQYGPFGNGRLLPITGAVEDNGALVYLPDDRYGRIIISSILTGGQVMASPFVHKIDGKMSGGGEAIIFVLPPGGSRRQLADVIGTQHRIFVIG